MQTATNFLEFVLYCYHLYYPLIYILVYIYAGVLNIQYTMSQNIALVHVVSPTYCWSPVSTAFLCIKSVLLDFTLKEMLFSYKALG